MIEREFGGIYSSNLGKSKDSDFTFCNPNKLTYSVLAKKLEKTIAE